MEIFYTKVYVVAQLLIVVIGTVTLSQSRHTFPDRLKEDQLAHTSTVASQITSSLSQTEHVSKNETRSRFDSERTVTLLDDSNDTPKVERVHSIDRGVKSTKAPSLHHLNKLRHFNTKRRGRRQARLGHHGHHAGHGVARTWKSCKTKSAFTHLTEAVDMFGKTVTIHPSVHIGKIAVDQYFYETFCDKEACECSGIDETRYRSSCETNYSFTYARVIQQGEIGWTKVMVRSGCSCVVRKRESPKWMVNIMHSI